MLEPQTRVCARQAGLRSIVRVVGRRIPDGLHGQVGAEHLHAPVECVGLGVAPALDVAWNECRIQVLLGQEPEPDRPVLRQDVPNSGLFAQPLVQFLTRHVPRGSVLVLKRPRSVRLLLSSSLKARLLLPGGEELLVRRLLGRVQGPIGRRNVSAVASESVASIRDCLQLHRCHLRPP